jgi:hypothetical protein
MNARILKLAPICLLIAAGLFAGCKKEAPPIPSGGGSGPAIVSAEKNSFEQVTAKLDKGGSFYLYLSTEQALGGLSKYIAAFSNLVGQTPLAPELGSQNIARIFEVVDGLVKDSGVEHISGVGASSIAREKGFYYSKLIVHHYPGQGDGMMWSAFGKAPHPLKELDLLPEDTAFAAYADADVALAWKTLQSELKKLHIPEVDQALASMPEQFKNETGMNLDDVLGSLGGGYGVILTLDQSKQISLPLGASSLEIPDPGLAIFFKVKNDAIYNRVDQLTSNNILFSKGNQDGVKTIGLSFASLLKEFDVPVPFGISPTLAHSGEYLILASSDKMLQDIIAVQTGKKAGFKSTAEFKRLSQGIPAEGNNFTLVSEKLGKTVNKATEGMGADVKNFQNLWASNATAFTYTVSANGPEGWESFANGSQSTGTAAVILPAVAAGGLLAAIAIPNFVRARDTAQANPGAASQRGGNAATHQSSCIRNLRLIDGAKMQWALEQHKMNTDTPTEKDLTPFLGRGEGGEFPVCPDGGKYIIGAIAEKPRCTIPGHVLP